MGIAWDSDEGWGFRLSAEAFGPPRTRRIWPGTVGAKPKLTRVGGVARAEANGEPRGARARGEGLTDSCFASARERGCSDRPSDAGAIALRPCVRVRVRVRLALRLVLCACADTSHANRT